MVEFRLLNFNEFDQAIALADQTFRDDEHISMGAAFPQVFSPALNQSYGAFINDRLVSFIGLVPSVIHLGTAQIQAFSIGAVCTHAAHRKKGYASVLLDRVLSHAEEAHASILFVSGSLPLYSKAGCQFYGELYKYEIYKDDLPQTGEYSVREFLTEDWFSLRGLYQSREVYVDQSIYDFALLYQSKGFASTQKMEHKLLVAETKNELKGFVVLGVPRFSSHNKTARVIEWAGNPQAIQAILAESFQCGIHSIRLSVPTYEKELNRHLPFIEKTVGHFPGTIKITNLNLLLEQLGPFLKGKIEITHVNHRKKKLLFNEKTILLENAALEKLILQGDLHLEPDLSGIFPIPLPFPEGLNYV